MVERDLAEEQMVAEIHLEPDFETVAVVSAELFATVAEIVAVADAVIGARVVDERIDEMVDEVADAGCAVVDVVIDAVVVDVVDVMSDEVFDEQGIQKGLALEGHSFLVMLVVDHYLVDMSASRQTVCLSADCFEHKYYQHLQRKY